MLLLRPSIALPVPPSQKVTATEASAVVEFTPTPTRAPALEPATPPPIPYLKSRRVALVAPLLAVLAIRPLVGLRDPAPFSPRSPTVPAASSSSIPRVVHMTHSRPDSVGADAATWRKALGVGRGSGWEVKVWDDAQGRALVASDHPRLLSAWDGLAKGVERADLFRYVVLLSRGGVYVDADVVPAWGEEDVWFGSVDGVGGPSISTPLDRLIAGLPEGFSQSPRLVAGYESDFDTPQEALRRTYGRQRQVLQWALVAPSGDPTLQRVADEVARRFALEAARQGRRADDGRGRLAPGDDAATIELTGPGLFTDVVVAASVGADEAKRPILLPRIAFGCLGGGRDGLPPGYTPDRLVRHRFEGGWKSAKHRSPLTGLAHWLIRGALRLAAEWRGAPPIPPATARHLPVAAPMRLPTADGGWHDDARVVVWTSASAAPPALPSSDRALRSTGRPAPWAPQGLATPPGQGDWGPTDLLLAAAAGAHLPGVGTRVAGLASGGRGGGGVLVDIETGPGPGQRGLAALAAGVAGLRAVHVAPDSEAAEAVQGAATGGVAIVVVGDDWAPAGPVAALRVGGTAAVAALEQAWPLVEVDRPSAVVVELYWGGAPDPSAAAQVLGRFRTLGYAPLHAGPACAARRRRGGPAAAAGWTDADGRGHAGGAWCEAGEEDLGAALAAGRATGAAEVVALVRGPMMSFPDPPPALPAAADAF